MLEKYVKNILQAPAHLLLPGAFILLLFIGYVDYVTGYYARISGLYLIPVFLLGLINRNYGLAMALAATIVGGMTDYFDKPRNISDIIFFWNIFMNLFVFSTFAVLLTMFKNEFSAQTNQARRDQLTGLYNLTAFYELAGIELQKSSRSAQSLTVIYLDCDNFKVVNDTAGHAAGDTLLKIVAQTMTDVLLDTDLVFRWGGDEFIAVLPDTGPKAASKAAEKLHPALRTAMQAGNWPVTFSIGVAVFQQLPTDLDDMLRKADGVMYEVKRSGKNATKHTLFADQPSQSI